MPYSIRFTSHGAEAFFTGTVDGKDIFEANESVYLHHYDGPLRWKLVDFTQASSLNISSHDVTSFANQGKNYLKENPSFVVAIIATSPVVFGFSRMYQAHVDQTLKDSIVVSSRSEAVAWLLKHGATQAELSIAEAKPGWVHPHPGHS